jgi:hypothetical protein
VKHTVDAMPLSLSLSKTHMHTAHTHSNLSDFGDFFLFQDGLSFPDTRVVVLVQPLRLISSLIASSACVGSYVQS